MEKSINKTFFSFGIENSTKSGVREAEKAWAESNNVAAWVSMDFLFLLNPAAQSLSKL
jgi:hypothetical protein